MLNCSASACVGLLLRSEVVRSVGGMGVGEVFLRFSFSFNMLTLVQLYVICLFL